MRNQVCGDMPLPLRATRVRRFGKDDAGWGCAVHKGRACVTKLLRKVPHVRVLHLITRARTATHHRNEREQTTSRRSVGGFLGRNSLPPNSYDISHRVIAACRITLLDHYVNQLISGQPDKARTPTAASTARTASGEERLAVAQPLYIAPPVRRVASSGQTRSSEPHEQQKVARLPRK